MNRIYCFPLNRCDDWLNIFHDFIVCLMSFVSAMFQSVYTVQRTAGRSRACTKTMWPVACEILLKDTRALPRTLYETRLNESIRQDDSYLYVCTRCSTHSSREELNFPVPESSQTKARCRVRYQLHEGFVREHSLCLLFWQTGATQWVHRGRVNKLQWSSFKKIDLKTRKWFYNLIIFISDAS